MQTDWYKEMQKQLVSLANDALTAADAPLEMRDGLVQLVIQRAIVFGHQECMRRLREQGILEGGTVREMRAVRPPPGGAPGGADDVHREVTAGFTVGAVVQPGVVSDEFKSRLAVLGVHL